MAGYKKYNSNGPSAEEKALDRFASIMIEKIESIKDDWKKPWFTEGSLVWPKNLSGREYNGMNALMLMMHSEKEGYRIPVFMTFERVTSLNYTKDKQGGKKPLLDKNGEELPHVGINKGEKSFPVFITTFTVVDKETKEKIKYDDFKQLSEDEKQKYAVYPKLQVYNVFNLDQSNIKEARPELYAKLVEQNTLKKPELNGEAFSFEPLDRMIRDNRWICPIKLIHQDNAFYSISKNEITLPEKSQFIDGESFCGTAFHEMSHSTGSEDFLNRLKPSGGFGSREYACEELIAELSSALIAQRYGMTKHLKEDSAAYLKSWLESLKESPEFIKTTLVDVKKASAIITQKIDAIQLEIDQEKSAKVNETQAPLKDLGTYDIPEWALNYLENGDATNLTDEEVSIIDKFTKEQFPNGFIMNVDWDNSNELNSYPAFGERNKNALVNRGESPFLAAKTYAVQFLDPVAREVKYEIPENELAVAESNEENHTQMSHRGR